MASKSSIDRGTDTRSIQLSTQGGRLPRIGEGGDAIRAQYAPLMDKRVEVHGTGRADMNGKHGVATDFHTIPGDVPNDRRYTVQLDSGEAFKVRPASVRAEGAGGGGGGGGTGAGKAKGKGKKGRSGRK